MRTLVIGLLIVGAWLALLPPFFTHGACSVEFDAASSQLERERSELRTLDQAEAYLRSHGIPHQILTAERCEPAPPRGVESCPGGPTLLASIPVKDRICSIYRDDRVRVQLGFNSRLQLVRLQTDMKPYRMLKSEWLGFELGWGK
jgi:hypothetical protein